MDKIPQDIIDQYKEEYLDKIVTIQDEEGQTIVGKLVFLGYNSFFDDWGLCATVERYPMQHIKLNSIKLNTTYKIV